MTIIASFGIVKPSQNYFCKLYVKIPRHLTPGPVVINLTWFPSLFHDMSPFPSSYHYSPFQLRYHINVPNDSFCAPLLSLVLLRALKKPKSFFACKNFFDKCSPNYLETIWNHSLTKRLTGFKGKHLKNLVIRRSWAFLKSRNKVPSQFLEILRIGILGSLFSCMFRGQ